MSWTTLRHAKRADWPGLVRFDLCMELGVLVGHVEGNDAPKDL